MGINITDEQHAIFEVVVVNVLVLYAWKFKRLNDFMKSFFMLHPNSGNINTGPPTGLFVRTTDNDCPSKQNEIY
jgi:hypothetical protein